MEDKLSVLKTEGICKITKSKMSIEEFESFCKSFLKIVKLLPDDPNVIRVSKDQVFGVSDMPWHFEGPWFNDDIITVTYNHKNCEKFPTEFINTNKVVEKYCKDIDYFKNIKVVLKNWGRIKSDEYKEVNVLQERDGKHYLFIHPKYTKNVLNDTKDLYRDLISKFEERDEDIENMKYTPELNQYDILIYDNSKIIHTRPKNLSDAPFDRELWRVTGIL